MPVTHFEDGVTDARGLWGLFGQLDPRRYVTFFDDFVRYNTGDWTITKIGAGTNALTNAHGGQLLITTSALSGDSVHHDKVGESFLFALGRQAFFEARVALSDVSATDFYVGLHITDTTPLDVTNGVYFQKANGSAVVNLYSEKGNVQTTALAAATMVNATFVRLGFYWDGKADIKAYVDGVHVGTLTPSTLLPDVQTLCASFGIQTNAAAAKTLTVDYIMAAMER